MSNIITNSGTNEKVGNGADQKSSNYSVDSSQLMHLFEGELKETYWAEKALAKTMPSMIKSATSLELVEALKGHLDEVKNQIKRAEQIFESLDKEAVGSKSQSLESLFHKAEEVIESFEAGPMCDAGIILALQKTYHYKIASYGTLSVFAKTFDEKGISDRLNETLGEVKNADEKLSSVAKSINFAAAEISK